MVDTADLWAFSAALSAADGMMGRSYRCCCEWFQNFRVESVHRQPDGNLPFEVRLNGVEKYDSPKSDI
jgi:hypothetical protein